MKRSDSTFIVDTDSESTESTPPRFYLLRQVFRSAGVGGIETYADLGIYTSEQRVRNAAAQFLGRESPHPDCPYLLYAWPCYVDAEAESGRHSGFYLN